MKDFAGGFAFLVNFGKVLGSAENKWLAWYLSSFQNFQTCIFLPLTASVHIIVTIPYTLLPAVQFCQALSMIFTLQPPPRMVQSSGSLSLTANSCMSLSSQTTTSTPLTKACYAHNKFRMRRDVKMHSMRVYAQTYKQIIACHVMLWYSMSLMCRCGIDGPLIETPKLWHASGQSSQVCQALSFKIGTLTTASLCPGANLCRFFEHLL